MTTLLERVRAATGADRRLDCEIAYHCAFEVEGLSVSFVGYCNVHDLDWDEIARNAESHQNILRHNLPRYTASVDAILALIERELPGVSWSIAFDDELDSVSWWTATVGEALSDHRGGKALALCAAFLAALETTNE